jgi:hypothetical protein
MGYLGLVLCIRHQPCPQVGRGALAVDHARGRRGLVAGHPTPSPHVSSPSCVVSSPASRVRYSKSSILLWFCYLFSLPTHLPFPLFYLRIANHPPRLPPSLPLRYSLPGSEAFRDSTEAGSIYLPSPSQPAASASAGAAAAAGRRVGPGAAGGGGNVVAGAVRDFLRESAHSSSSSSSSAGEEGPHAATAVHTALGLGSMRATAPGGGAAALTAPAPAAAATFKAAGEGRGAVSLAPELQQFFSDTHKRPTTLPRPTIQQQEQGLGSGASTSRRFATTLTNTLGGGTTGVTLGVTSGTTMRLDGTGTKRRPPVVPLGLPVTTLWRPREPPSSSGGEAGAAAAAAADEGGAVDESWAQGGVPAGEQEGAGGSTTLTHAGAGGDGHSGLDSSLEGVEPVLSSSLEVLSSSSHPSSRQHAASSSAAATGGEPSGHSPAGSTSTTSRAPPAAAGGGEGQQRGATHPLVTQLQQQQGATGSRTAAAALTGSMSPGELSSFCHTGCLGGVAGSLGGVRVQCVKGMCYSLIGALCLVPCTAGPPKPVTLCCCVPCYL